MSRTAAIGRSGSSADLPSRPDRPRQEIGLHKQNQTPAFPAGFPRRVLFSIPLHESRRCRGRCPHRPEGPLLVEGAVCAPRRQGEFLKPFFSFSARKKRMVSIFQEKKEGCAKPELHPVPPSCNNSVAQSYLPAPDHLSAGNYAPHAILMMAGRQHFADTFVGVCFCSARFSPFAAQTGPIPVPPA